MSSTPTKTRHQPARKVAREKNSSGTEGKTMAELADRHALYQASVQSAEFELEFMEATFKEWTGRAPRTMREDFCGTALSAVEWVRRNPANSAVGIDNDPEVLDWGRKHNVATLNEEQLTRLELIEGDVRDVNTAKFDVIQAFNFSYWFFQRRKDMVAYMASLRESLVDAGMLFLDFFGGSECYSTQKEKRKITEYEYKFKYVWEQESFNALTNEVHCHIHFHFPDKSKLKKAFSYTWRVWGASEMREILEDAGYSEIALYRQEFDDETDEALDEYVRTDEGEDYACWLGYILARR